jgi:small subunit ribosomal protein S9
MAEKKIAKEKKAVKKVKKVVKKTKKDMAPKEAKLVKKMEEKAEEIMPEVKSDRTYFYAVGKRKTSVARVKLYPADEKGAKFFVNGKEVEKYFPILRLSQKAKESLNVTGKEKSCEAVVSVYGGGINSQSEAVRLGIARALVKMDETLKKSLKDKGLMTRDSRKVERKKPGLKKARRSPQWAKR